MTNIQQPYWVKARILDDNPLSQKLGGFVWLENKPPCHETHEAGYSITTNFEEENLENVEGFFYFSNFTFYGMRGRVYPRMVELTNEFRMNREDIPIVEIGEEN